jgi:hypothetical protein
MYVLILFTTVILAVLPGVLFQQHSRIFLVKVAVIVLLASLPGLLYVQFLRFRGNGLYDEYVINLFRLGIDRYRNLPAPPKHTSYFQIWKADHRKLDKPGTDNLYRFKFETVYGPRCVSTRDLIAVGAEEEEADGGRQAGSPGVIPVLLATVLLCLGWQLVLQPELFRAFDLLGGLPFSGQPQLPEGALRYGFIGAYWFIIQDLLRRYLRRDLRATAYVSASVRLIIVALVVPVIALIPLQSPAQPNTGALLNAIAFLVGIFPQFGVRLLYVWVRQMRLGSQLPKMDSAYPLENLDGMSMWYQARLLEEGVEDMRALSTANLVDLLVGARLPISSLMDWIDQSLLCVLLPEPAEGSASTRTQVQARCGLRALGIKTATALKREWTVALAEGRSEKQELIAKAVGSGDAGAGRVAVEAVLGSLAGSPNFVHVETFRRHEWLDPPEKAKALAAA